MTRLESRKAELEMLLGSAGLYQKPHEAKLRSEEYKSVQELLEKAYAEWIPHIEADWKAHIFSMQVFIFAFGYWLVD